VLCLLLNKQTGEEIKPLTRVNANFVADGVFVLVAPDELKAKKLLMMIQQKNRHRDLNYKKRFVVGADTAHMRIFDAEDSVQPVNENQQDTQKAKAKNFAGFT